jgi:hypothetical protein
VLMAISPSQDLPFWYNNPADVNFISQASKYHHVVRMVFPFTVLLGMVKTRRISCEKKIKANAQDCVRAHRIDKVIHYMIQTWMSTVCSLMCQCWWCTKLYAMSPPYNSLTWSPCMSKSCPMLKKIQPLHQWATRKHRPHSLHISSLTSALHSMSL